jgi:serralysin
VAETTGDGKADIVGFATNGVWTSTTALSTSPMAAPGSSEADGASLHKNGPTAAPGEFNGNGAADIVWQNNHGLPMMWSVDGTTELGGINPDNSGAGWHLV